ncbi:DUF3939 domain-containing protein [Gorillibacterium sp. sgz5001074]|uniref:DUF3939 domain-containing protein n=1 Tax=Gorillibacterium sp. sgz5001074 TaxID=3446695 RepID=UPI003F660FB4
MFGMKKKPKVVLGPPTVAVTLAEVKSLVREFEQHLPKGMNRTVLIGPDNEINFHLLIPYLHGLPSRKFYMSRETFEIFPEEERHIPYWLDIVQRAVDAYIVEEGAAPVVFGDVKRRINCALLHQYYLLKELPPLDFYLSDQEDLITHIPAVK